MSFALRYASHLGYRSPEQPLFRHSVGSLDVFAHIDFAAELGLAGVQDAWAMARPTDEQKKIGAALAKRGLEAGALIAVPTRERIRDTHWATKGAWAAGDLAAPLDAAIAAAQRIGSRWVGLFSGALPGVPLALQQAAFIDNLRFAADRARKADVVLLLENMSFKSIPHMLLHHIGDAYLIARAVDHAHVKLMFDTSHIQIMDGDLLANMEAVWSEVALVQIADNPGRLEPGSGEINFASVFRALKARGYRGLVELEHGWSEATAACETRGLERLRALDAA